MLDDVCAVYEDRAVDLLALEDALQELRGMDPQLVELVELRFFAGLEVGAVADVLGVSRSTAERGWRTARTWLRAALDEA